MLFTKIYGLHELDDFQRLQVRAEIVTELMKSEMFFKSGVGKVPIAFVSGLVSDEDKDGGETIIVELLNPSLPEDLRAFIREKIEIVLGKMYPGKEISVSFTPAR